MNRIFWSIICAKSVDGILSRKYFIYLSLMLYIFHATIQLTQISSPTSFTIFMFIIQSYYMLQPSVLAIFGEKQV